MISKDFYQKTIRILLVLAVIGLIVLLVPILQVSTVNRASGDDYGYGAWTHRAWMVRYSLWDVVKAVGKTIRDTYKSWQGTWFSIFLFSLQPEVFSRYAYACVTPIMLILWMGSTFYLGTTVFHHKMKLDKATTYLLIIVFLIMVIEFIPGTKSSLFWYNGCAHYMIPFCMCQFQLGWLFRYEMTQKKRYLVGIGMVMILLGGSNYQAFLLSFLITIFYVLYKILLIRKAPSFIFWIMIFAQIVGFLISALAPGNKYRAGDDFGFSVNRALMTIGKSFSKGSTDIARFIAERPVTIPFILAFLLVFGYGIYFADENREVKTDEIKDKKRRIPYRILMSLLLGCVYFAMEAPEIYANVDVSQGVDNTYFLVFWSVIIGISCLLLPLVIRAVKGRVGEKIAKFNIGSLFILLGCCCMLLMNKSSLKSSTSYICYDYWRDGRAADYKQQMILQTNMLLSSRTRDEILPSINDDQGPLMHMPITIDPKEYTNEVVRIFYDKDTVIAIYRHDWEKQYPELMQKYGQ